MKKIKIVMITSILEINGISKVILNYCRELNHDVFDLSVITGPPISVENEKECRHSGIKLIEIPSKYCNPIKYCVNLWRTIKTNKYDIIHIHGNSSTMAIEVILAKLAGSKINIVHSHNSTCSYTVLHRILNPYFRLLYTKALACGVLAGNWLFDENKFEVLPNGFYTEQFQFDGENRRKIRKELDLEDKRIIGHVGRFNDQKNHQYILKIFEKVAEIRDDAVLLLVGTGPNFKKIKALADEHPYKNRIILYGETKNVQAMYSAMDIFVLPSRFEGLPFVLLEAQIAGLPCVVSDKVTKELDFGNIFWESIDIEPEVWAGKIINIKINQESERVRYYFANKDKILKYNIKSTVKQLERIYMELIQN